MTLPLVSFTSTARSTDASGCVVAEIDLTRTVVGRCAIHAVTCVSSSSSRLLLRSSATTPFSIATSCLFSTKAPSFKSQSQRRLQTSDFKVVSFDGGQTDVPDLALYNLKKFEGLRP